MSRFRRAQPSPALVVSIIALVVAMGGTAYAGFSVPKNSVGSNQLKKNAVTTKKIKNAAVTDAKITANTITGDKLKLSTLGTVPSATTANNATHASTADNATHASTADNATHASTADNATHASTADNATHASTADNANSVGGNPVRWLLVNPAGTIVSQSGGFTVDGHPSTGLYFVNAGSTVSGHAIVASDGLAGDGGFRGVTIAGPCGAGPDALPCGGAFDDGKHILVATTTTANTTEADHSFYIVMY
jgi:hypothetical protein